jgi:hypothetical protein
MGGHTNIEHMCGDEHTEGAGVGKRWEIVDGYARLSTDTLVEGYAQMCALSRAAHGISLAMLAVLGQRCVHATDGATDMAAWVAMRVALHPRAARAECEVAEALVNLGHIGGLVASGELSMDQLRPLVRLADADTEEHWAKVAPSMTPAQLDHAARRSEAVSNADAKDVYATRRVSWRNAGAGAMSLSARLPNDMGLVITQALSALACDAPPLPDGGYDPWRARCADALVSCCETRLTERTSSPRATVVVHVSTDQLRAEQPSAEQPSTEQASTEQPSTEQASTEQPSTEQASTTGGAGFSHSAEGLVLAPVIAQRLACDARLAVLVEDSAGVPLGVGRTSRVVPSWLETLVSYRDEGRCRYPGCERTRGTQCHHIRHWADGGPTDLANLVTLCSRHHHLVHEGGFSLGGDPDAPAGLWVSRPDGTRASPAWITLDQRVRQCYFGDGGNTSTW